MKDVPHAVETSLAGLSDREAWLEKAAEIADDAGYLERLGESHAAILIEEKPTLLVTFETHESINRQSGSAQPMGWEMVRALGWSHLCIVSDGDTWFRDRRVYGFFDRLVDDGFFEDFEQVIFYGAGSCGYAAAAFSVAAPGATVIALQPQATLDPRVAEWDDRFVHMRRTSFTDRYGYAPDMLDAAHHAFVLYDPEIELDAMHAALFTRPNVTKFRMRHMGAPLDAALMRSNILLRILARASADRLDRASLAQLFRARRKDLVYLRAVLARLEGDKRHYLTALLAQYVMARTPGPRFRRAVRSAYDRAAELDLPMPARTVT